MRTVLTDLLDNRFDADSGAAQPSIDRTRRG
jgi:hypothetical protein